MNIVNTRVIQTRAYDAISFDTECPKSEKYKNNVLYKGATLWNLLTIPERYIESNDSMKKHLKDLIYNHTVPYI